MVLSNHHGGVELPHPFIFQLNPAENETLNGSVRKINVNENLAGLRLRDENDIPVERNKRLDFDVGIYKHDRYIYHQRRADLHYCREIQLTLA